MNVMILGGGGRESALARKLSQCPQLTALYIAPGNAGTEQYGQNIAVAVDDFAGIAQVCRDKAIDLLVVGPEMPLINGVADYIDKHAPATRVFGPRQSAARLEGSKAYAKAFMCRHGVPTAEYIAVCDDNMSAGANFIMKGQGPYVLKADGPAAGKGTLIVPRTLDAVRELRTMLAGKFGQASYNVVIERFLKGPECSVFVITDGRGNYRTLPVAMDYKRALDGDRGLNTGGMGAISPVPHADEEFRRRIDQRIVRPTLAGLMAEDIDYRGVIYFGVINVDGDPYLLEYNVRFGDPESSSVFARTGGNLLSVLMRAASGDLAEDLAADDDLTNLPVSAVTVVAIAGGYPLYYHRGMEITGNLDPADAIVLHAGTARNDEGKTVVAGGRVLDVVGIADTLDEARKKSYEALGGIHFADMAFRTDIGAL